jgi:hypothetical protein
MLKKTFMVACLFAGLAACERPSEPAPATGEQKRLSSVPEHFDRVRAEQVEKEEEKFRRRGRN